MKEFKFPVGQNFHCAEQLDIKTLRGSLCLVLSFLQLNAPYIKLVQYDDWLEHDGLHFLKQEINFSNAFSICESPQSLLEAMPDDDRVRVGIASERRDWYLRFIVKWDERGENLKGNFDITIPESLTSKFKTEVQDKLTFPLEAEAASKYYARIKSK